MEDDPDTRAIVVEHLRDEEFELVTAENGRVALEALDSFAPDLILLDLMMPEMDGMTFLGVVRSRESLWHLPVVVVTAKDLNAREIHTLEQQVAVVVKKGPDFEFDLKKHVRRILSETWTRIAL